jgi:hypothetical protein
MPRRRRTPTSAIWTICSVFVRTRDGPERLADTYRRLLAPVAESRPAAITGLAEGETPCARHLCPRCLIAPALSSLLAEQINGLSIAAPWAAGRGRALSEAACRSCRGAPRRRGRSDRVGHGVSERRQDPERADMRAVGHRRSSGGTCARSRVVSAVGTRSPHNGRPRGWLSDVSIAVRSGRTRACGMASPTSRQGRSDRPEKTGRNSERGRSQLMIDPPTEPR